MILVRPILGYQRPAVYGSHNCGTGPHNFSGGIKETSMIGTARRRAIDGSNRFPTTPKRPDACRTQR